MLSYINLFGEKCFTSSERTIEYPIDLLKLFDDVISMTTIRCPVVLDDIPNTVFDRYNLIKWFSTSNVEPTTGTKMKSSIKYMVLLNYYVAMMLLEEKKGKLIFHQPKMDLYNLYKLVQKLQTHTKKTTKSTRCIEYACQCKPLPESGVFLDEEMYITKKKDDNNDNEDEVKEQQPTKKIKIEPKEKKIQAVNADYTFFTLEDVLLNDMYTGLPITKPVIDSDGILRDRCEEKESSVICDPGQNDFGYHYYTTSETRQSTNGSFIMKTIQSIFQIKNGKATLSEKIHAAFDDRDIWSRDISRIIADYAMIRKKPVPGKSNPSKTYFIFDSISFDCAYERLHATGGARDDDFYMSCTTTYENMFQTFLKCLASFDTPKKKQEFNEKKKILSNLVKNHPSYVLSGTNMALIPIRRIMNFPILSMETGYGDDFSLLDLEGCNFAATSEVMLKGVEFIGTNLKKVVFKNINFMVVSFIGMNMLSTLFINCKFSECLFYKSRTPLINRHLFSSFDAQSRKTYDECQTDFDDS